MKIHKLKILLIGICCFTIALCSETKSMDGWEVSERKEPYKTNTIKRLKRYMDREAWKIHNQEIDKQKSLGAFAIFPSDIQIIILSKGVEVSDNSKFNKSLFLNPYFLELIKKGITHNPPMFLWILEAAKPSPQPGLFSLPNYETVRQGFKSVKERAKQIFYDYPVIPIPLGPLVLLTNWPFLRNAYTFFVPEGVQESLWKGYQAFSYENLWKKYQSFLRDPEEENDKVENQLVLYEENNEGYLPLPLESVGDNHAFLWKENDEIKEEQANCSAYNDIENSYNEWTLSLSIPSLLKLSPNEDVFAFLMAVLEYIEEYNATPLLFKRNFMDYWHDMNQERIGLNYQALHDNKDLYKHADIYRSYYHSWKDDISQENSSYPMSNDEQWLATWAFFSQKSFDLAKKEIKILKWADMDQALKRWRALILKQWLPPSLAIEK